MVGARLRIARFFVLQCQCCPPSVTIPFPRASECCPPSVPNPFLRVSELCSPSVSAPLLRSSVLSTSERCPPQCPFCSSVPQSAVHRQCAFRSSVPQSAVHRQCPLRSFVPQCCSSSISGKGHSLLPRCVTRHGFFVSGHCFLVLVLVVRLTCITVCPQCNCPHSNSHYRVPLFSGKDHLILPHDTLLLDLGGARALTYNRNSTA